MSTVALDTVVMMNKREADDASQRINLIVQQAGTLIYQGGLILLDYRDRQGWRAQGYASFQEGAMKEFPEIAGTKQQVSRLTQNAEVTKVLGEAVSTKVSRELAKVPEAQVPEVYHVAKEAAGSAPVTPRHVRAAKAQVQAPAPAAEKPTAEKPSAEAKPKPAAAAKPAKAAAPKKPAVNEKYEAALERIGLICGANVRKAVVSGALANVTEKGAIFWASLKDTPMLAIQELVVAKRWDPKKAHEFLEKAPDERTRICELTNLAIAGGGSVLVVVGSFATVCFNIRKLPAEYAKIKKLLGLEK